MRASGFFSSPFILSLTGLAVIGYLQNATGSIAVSLIVTCYSVTNLLLKRVETISVTK